MIDQRLEKQLYAMGLRDRKIKKIILFGSRAIGDNTAKSDIDLVFVAPEMTTKEWAGLTFYLEVELDTLLFLDLNKFENAADQLKNEIIDTGETIYSREMALGKDVGNHFIRY